MLVQPSPPPAQFAISACHTSQLAITLARSGAAAGTVGGYIGFRNNGAAPCRMSGWPALFAVTAGGVKVAARHVLSTMFGPTGIKIPPGVVLAHGALAEVAFTGNDVLGPCASGRPPTYRTLRVSPPGDARTASLSAWLPYLDAYLPACGTIFVSPIVSAADLYNPPT